MAQRSGTSKVVVCKLTNTITQQTIDLSSIVRGINIYNSLESMCTSGDLAVMDQGNMIEEYQLNGQEIIDIEIHINDEGNLSEDENIYKRRFFVFAIDSVTGEHDKMNYIIRFIDQFALINTDTRISFHYKKMKGEDIIKKINSIVNSEQSSNYKNVINNTYQSTNCNQNGADMFPFKSDVSTKYEFDLYVPMWKPLQLIEYIKDRCVSNENTNEWADTVFYQDKKGVYHFSSFKNVFQKSNQLQFAQQLTPDITNEPSHLVISYTFNKIYDIQLDKLNGIYGVQFGIADFKPETSVITSSTVLGIDLGATSEEREGTDGIVKADGTMNLQNYINDYFGDSLGSIRNLSSAKRDDKDNTNPSKERKEAGIIDPFRLKYVNMQSNQTATTKGNSKTVSYNNQSGAVIYLDTCGMIHENDTEYDEYKKFTLPAAKGMVMKKVLSTYIINCEMNGSFDVDLGKTFVMNMPQEEGVTKQLSAFVNGVTWMIASYRHTWDYEKFEVKTYVTGVTPFLKRGEKAQIRNN